MAQLSKGSELTLEWKLASKTSDQSSIICGRARSWMRRTIWYWQDPYNDGRVAFLVRCGQAQSEGILFLAYGRDAAKDMHEPKADDEPARKRFVQLAIEGFQSEPGYRERLLQYFENYRFPIKNPFQSFFRVPN